MHKVFIVEDDAAIAGAIQRRLCAWGLEAACAEDFSDILPQFVSYAPQLVLMDVGLPCYNGYHWCAQIRKLAKTPVIFLSSAADNMNIVMAMNMGGDDFIAKPFDMDVLIAKIQAMLRRSYEFAGEGGLMEHRGAILKLADALLYYKGEKIELTKNEYRILQTLLQHKGEAVSREALMAKLWETDSFVDENALTVNVARLRKKLSAAGLEEFITTRRGMGYVIE